MNGSLIAEYFAALCYSLDLSLHAIFILRLHQSASLCDKLTVLRECEFVHRNPVLTADNYINNKAMNKNRSAQSAPATERLIDVVITEPH